MKQLLTGFCLVLTGGLWLMADPPALVPVTQPAPAVFTDDLNGENVTVTVGQRFAVQLAGNPATGYAWRLGMESQYQDFGGVLPPGASQPTDQRVLRLVRPLTFTPFDKPPANEVGASGVYRVEFEAVAVGKRTVVLNYGKPQDGPDLVNQIYTLTVVVQPAGWVKPKPTATPAITDVP